ncbi:MAG: hypothetical protein ACOY30_14735 [Bacillota bacterium]
MLPALGNGAYGMPAQPQDAAGARIVLGCTYEGVRQALSPD